ncbi:MAG TPA: FAD-dependent monooxygenase [Candidatus Limnocylindria bacterium]|jgi:2-polyprenyl-6-methoxyphenol hydroxylase-like FAD-dependent oxidoreductase
MPALDAQIAVVGAGPIGMTLAGRLAQHGLSVILLEEHPAPTGEGSKALCMQRETLEIWDRLGIGERVGQRGIQWNVGRTYFRDRELFSVHLPGSGDDHFPPFVNISQTEVEELLRHRVGQLPNVEMRWGQRLTVLQQNGEAVRLTCETVNGPSIVTVAYAIGADGAHSSVRHLLGVAFPGHSHEDLFLICDIRATLPFPRERRFFFDPPWNPGRQVLVHPQPDDLWRIDWQVPSGTDAEAERASGALDHRIRQVVGATTPYELAWVTAYRFHQRIAPRFRVGRVLLAGDAAHLMSPFGARGLNSGAADAENLAWKLQLVLGGRAPEALLDSYDAERRAAAVENLAVTDASMRFMVPHGPLRRGARNAILRGSVRFAALRRLVNSGRLSQPFTYKDSPVVAPPHQDVRLPVHGSVAPDARCSPLGPERNVARLRDLIGPEFLVLLVCRTTPERAAAMAIRAAGLSWPAPCRVAVVGADTPLRGVSVLRDDVGELVRVYGAAGSRAWLIRPDGHLAGSMPLAGRDAVDRLPALQAMAIGMAGAPVAHERVPSRRRSLGTVRIRRNRTA